MAQSVSGLTTCGQRIMILDRDSVFGLRRKTNEKVGQKMQEAYEALPKAFMGYPARILQSEEADVWEC